MKWMNRLGQHKFYKINAKAGNYFNTNIIIKNIYYKIHASRFLKKQYEVT